MKNFYFKDQEKNLKFNLKNRRRRRRRRGQGISKILIAFPQCQWQTFNYPKRENNSMGTTKRTSQRVTKLGTFANMGREQQGNNWERLQTWEESNKGTIGNFCKHANRETRELLGTFANMGTEQQENNWELLRTWEHSNKGTCPLASASARERETAKTTNAVARILSFVAKVWRPPSPTFFFFVFFLVFFTPHGFHMVCVLFAAHSLCVCVFFLERTVL